MAYKSNSRKLPKIKGRKKGAREKKAIEGEEPCQIKGCENWADKKLGGRSLAFDNAADVWDDSEIIGSGRRVRICKPCYRHYKKASKDDDQQTW